MTERINAIVMQTATLSDTDWTAVTNFDSDKWAALEITNHSNANDLRFRFHPTTGDGRLLSAISDKDHTYTVPIPDPAVQPLPLDANTALYVKAVVANVEYTVTGLKVI